MRLLSSILLFQKAVNTFVFSGQNSSVVSYWVVAVLCGEWCENFKKFLRDSQEATPHENLLTFATAMQTLTLVSLSNT